MITIIDMGCRTLHGLVEALEYEPDNCIILRLPFHDTHNEKVISKHIYTIHDAISSGLVDSNWVIVAIPDNGCIKAFCRLVVSFKEPGQGSAWSTHLKVVYE